MDKQQSTAFGRGVQRALDMLEFTAESHPKFEDEPCAVGIQNALLRDIRRAPLATAAGFAATLGQWLAEARHTENDARYWWPFGSKVIERNGKEFPPPDHTLFRLMHTPMSMGPAHDAYNWQGDRARRISPKTILGDVSSVVHVITRREFDKLRSAKKEA